MLRSEWLLPLGRMASEWQWQLLSSWSACKLGCFGLFSNAAGRVAAAVTVIMVLAPGGCCGLFSDFVRGTVVAVTVAMVCTLDGCDRCQASDAARQIATVATAADRAKSV